MELEEGDLNQVDDRPRENRRQDRAGPAMRNQTAPRMIKVLAHKCAANAETVSVSRFSAYLALCQ